MVSPISGTFTVGRQKRHQIRISWEEVTQLLWPPGWKWLKHALKQKLRYLRIFTPKSLLPAAFKHTRGYWWVSVWYFRKQAYNYCLPPTSGAWLLWIWAQILHKETQFQRIPYLWIFLKLSSRKWGLPRKTIANCVACFIVRYLSIAFQYKKNIPYFSWCEVLISFSFFVKVPDVVQFDLSCVFGHQAKE